MTMGLKYYMHQNCMDIAVAVLKEEDGLLYCRFLNLGYDGKPFFQGSTFVTEPETFSECVVLSEEQVYKKRTEPGIPE